MCLGKPYSFYRRTKGATAIEYGILAALIVLLALFFITITGVNLKNVFTQLGTAFSGGVQYAQNCAPAAKNYPVVFTNYNPDGLPWGFPGDSCGQGGISGPPTTKLNYTYLFSFNGNGDFTGLSYTNSAGQQVVYAVVANPWPGYNFNTYRYQGPVTLFSDGYSDSASYISGTSETFAAFSKTCESGASQSYQYSDTLSLYSGANNQQNINVIYAPGTPYKTSGGAFICGNTHIATSTTPSNITITNPLLK